MAWSQGMCRACCNSPLHVRDVSMLESKQAEVKGYLVLGWGSFHMGGGSILEDASELV